MPSIKKQRKRRFEKQDKWKATDMVKQVQSPMNLNKVKDSSYQTSN